jgi:hypothetical protein
MKKLMNSFMITWRRNCGQDARHREEDKGDVEDEKEAVGMPGRDPVSCSATTMRTSWALCALLAAALPAHALRAEDAGVLDWHVPLVGVPLTQFARTAPVVHRARAVDALIVTATQSNVLAGIHPDNGTLGWLIKDPPMGDI